MFSAILIKTAIAKRHRDANLALAHSVERLSRSLRVCVFAAISAVVVQLYAVSLDGEVGACAVLVRRVPLF